MTTDALHRELRSALDELAVTHRAAIEHDREVLESYDDIRRSIATALRVSRDHLVEALARVDAALLALSEARLDQERDGPDTPLRE